MQPQPLRLTTVTHHYALLLQQRPRRVLSDPPVNPPHHPDLPMQASPSVETLLQLRNLSHLGSPLPSHHLPSACIANLHHTLLPLPHGCIASFLRTPYCRSRAAASYCPTNHLPLWWDPLHSEASFPSASTAHLLWTPETPTGASLLLRFLWQLHLSLSCSLFLWVLVCVWVS